MKYVVTLRDRTYEVEVEHGEAMLLDEYEAKAPAGAAPAPVAAAPVAAAAPAAAPAPVVAGDGTPVVAPMPGNITAVQVNVGDAVTEGQVVMLMEAMKMTVEVVAPCAGTVKQIIANVGKVVATDDTLMMI